MTVSPENPIDAGIEQIRYLLEKNHPFLRFPRGLEGAFRRHVQQRSIALLTYAWWVIVSFYFFLGVMTWTQLQTYSDPSYLPDNERVWWAIFLVEGAVIAALLMLPRLPRLDRWYRYYVLLIAMVSVSTIIIGTSAFPDSFFNQHSSYVVILVIAIIYGIGGLRLVPAMAACISAAVISVGVIHWYDLWYNWGHFSQYVVLANTVGMLLGYLLEHRDRTMFLQSELLELEKRKTDELSQEFNRLSREDALTGLANRRHFNEVFQQEWDRARRDRRPVALIFVDVDHFKPFNDTHGHVEGDKALALVGVALKTVLRRSGDIAARYGGEEFVLLLPGTGLDGAREVALQVARGIRTLAIPHGASSVASHVTVSMGVAAQQPDGDLRGTQLLAAADEAVYAAKEAGRNCIMTVRPDGTLDPEPLRLS
ncbi:MAG: GGDEF domain-containing protein [Gammaproteobacteria bacterium]